MTTKLFLNDPIVYLDNDDFDEQGELKQLAMFSDSSKPIFIMIQSNFCGFCSMAKPHYQEFATENKDKAYFATIQGDEARPERSLSIKLLMDRITKIYPEFFGYPSYLILYKGKKFKYEKDRTKASLNEVLNQILSSETTTTAAPTTTSG